MLSDYLSSSRFWFEAFQNWQSEFLAIGCMVVLSIWLREVNSPESKKVETPHWENEERAIFHRPRLAPYSHFRNFPGRR